jgi:hypothetical protein
MAKYIMVFIIAALVGVGAMYIYTATVGDTLESKVTVNSIKKIAELATIEYNMSIIEEQTKKKKFLEWKEARFLVLLTGVIKGSVDLNQADVNIDKEAKKVTIAFKKNAVNISNPEIGPGDIKIITVSDPNVFHKINDADRNKAQAAAIKLLRKAALDKGIVNQTKSQAKTVIENFLAALGFQSVISFQ